MVEVVVEASEVEVVHEVEVDHAQDHAQKVVEVEVGMGVVDMGVGKMIVEEGISVGIVGCV